MAFPIPCRIPDWDWNYYRQILNSIRNHSMEEELPPLKTNWRYSPYLILNTLWSNVMQLALDRQPATRTRIQLARHVTWNPWPSPGLAEKIRPLSGAGATSPALHSRSCARAWEGVWSWTQNRYSKPEVQAWGPLYEAPLIALTTG